jgi:hypothetical protein
MCKPGNGRKAEACNGIYTESVLTEINTIALLPIHFHSNILLGVSDISIFLRGQTVSDVCVMTIKKKKLSLYQAM